MHYLHLEAKIRRQAAYLAQIQKVGWQPGIIIHEEPDLFDLHTGKRRVQNRYAART